MMKDVDEGVDRKEVPKVPDVSNQDLSGEIQSRRLLLGNHAD